MKWWTLIHTYTMFGYKYMMSDRPLSENEINEMMNLSKVDIDLDSFGFDYWIALNFITAVECYESREEAVDALKRHEDEEEEG